VFGQGRAIPMWRGHLALVIRRRQDAGWTQGRDGLATSDNRDEAATHCGQDALVTRGRDARDT